MLRLSPLLRGGAAALVVIAAFACGGSPYDLGVTGGSSSSSTVASSSSSVSSSASSSSSGTGGVGGDPEPAGTLKLTVVNGINDYYAVRLCFLPNDTPWPSSANGLPFGRSAVITPGASTVPIDGDVTPWVIAGDLSQTDGKTCTEILALAAADAGTSAIVARPLGVIPKVVWATNRSLLLVPSGCVGGFAHEDPSATVACGMGYTGSSPTAGLTLVSMSRIEDGGHVSLQAVSASPALPEVDVALLPSLTDATPRIIAHALSQGAILPKPPFAALTVTEMGPLDTVQIQTYTPGSMNLSSTVPLSKVFANGGPGAAAVVNGARFVLVAVGAGPGLPTDKWWHELTWTLVAADP
ncbi:Hypothetical protein A7982_10584 [Minicystis rosea]|nr:Hypothetical protein A7982_10584 [Minicystis rosea]